MCYIVKLLLLFWQNSVHCFAGSCCACTHIRLPQCHRGFELQLRSKLKFKASMTQKAGQVKHKKVIRRSLMHSFASSKLFLQCPFLSYKYTPGYHM